jgi:hypothetical protein
LLLARAVAVLKFFCAVGKIFNSIFLGVAKKYSLKNNGCSVGFELFLREYFLWVSKFVDKITCRL